MRRHYVNIGVREGKQYCKRIWRVLGPRAPLKEGEREINLKIDLPDDFFSGPVIHITVELPPDHGVKITQDK